MITREQYLRSTGVPCWYCECGQHDRCESLSCSCFSCHGDTSQPWEAKKAWAEHHDQELAKRVVDLIVSGGGTVYLLFATSPRGETWIDEHIPDDAQWFAGGVAVEHRYIDEICGGAVSDGLRILLGGK